MILFLGDSITQWWDAEYFNHYFGMYKTINLGMSGHTSKDTLEYIELSHLNNFKPSNVILQIGTNDGDHDMTTGETVATIQRICSTILDYSPGTKILLIGPLPRGESLSDRHRIYNREVNNHLQSIIHDTRVTYVDIGVSFIREDGTISKNTMYDYLHLTKRGYDILSEVICNYLFAPRGFFGPCEPATPAPLPRLS